MRTSPPWNEGGPALRVGWDPSRQEYVLRAPGGHIIGCTDDPTEVLEAIRFEAEWGYGSMELKLQGCRQCQTYHGLRTTATTTIRTGRKKTSGPSALTLEDLGL